MCTCNNRCMHTVSCHKVLHTDGRLTTAMPPHDSFEQPASRLAGQQLARQTLSFAPPNNSRQHRNGR